MGDGRGTGLPPADTSSRREPARDGEIQSSEDAAHPWHQAGQLAGAQEVFNPTLGCRDTRIWPLEEPEMPVLLPSDGPSPLPGSSVLGVTHTHLTGALHVMFFNFKIHLYYQPSKTALWLTR